MDEERRFEIIVKVDGNDNDEDHYRWAYEHLYKQMKQLSSCAGSVRMCVISVTPVKEAKEAMVEVQISPELQKLRLDEVEGAEKPKKPKSRISMLPPEPTDTMLLALDDGEPIGSKEAYKEEETFDGTCEAITARGSNCLNSPVLGTKLCRVHTGMRRR